MTIGIETNTLDGLPEPAVIAEIDIEAIISAMRDRLVELYPNIAGTVDLETALSRMVIEVFAYREGLLRADINDAARANVLYFAQGADLDHLAAFYDVVRMVGEDDARLRARVVLAIQGRSPAGTAARYRSVVMGVSTRIADAIAWSNGSDAAVNVAVFTTDANGIADQALLDEVSLALNSSSVKMVNDNISVVSAVSQTIDVEADVWLLPETANSVLTELPDALRADHVAENGLGFDLTTAWLTGRLMRPGVQKVVVKNPITDIIVGPYTAVSLGTVTINDKGRSF